MPGSSGAKIHDTTQLDVDKCNHNHTADIDENEVKYSSYTSTLVWALVLYSTEHIGKRWKTLLNEHVFGHQICVPSLKFLSSVLSFPFPRYLRITMPQGAALRVLMWSEYFNMC